ncbi:MAG: hypothetical protein AAGI09_00060 [Pseudomonadota bacterium]
MTSYRYANPDLVLLDIPGTGSMEVRAVLSAPVETRRVTRMQAPDLPVLALVAHPFLRFARILEAFATRQDRTSAPRLPGLTAESALDILENPRAPLDHSRAYPQAQLKAALAPQTHPIRHLHSATRVLRTEDPFPEDLPSFTALDRPETLPDWPVEIRDRLTRIYAEDFALLGYAPDDIAPQRAIAQIPTPAPQVWDLWPAFFDHQDVRIDTAAEALPPPDVDLAPFAESLVGGRRGNTWAGREPNLIRHFRKLQPEFADQSRLTHLLAAVVVILRRDPDCTEAAELFHKITEGYSTQLASEMKLRWLVSITDSFADHGRNQGQRAMGIAGSLLANTLKLSETERRIYAVPRPWPPQRRLAGGGPLFDGMITYWVEKGEMITLMTQRLDRVCADDPQAGPFTREILRRAHRNNTVYRRLSQLAGTSPPPLLDAELTEELEKLTSDLL